MAITLSMAIGGCSSMSAGFNLGKDVTVSVYGGVGTISNDIGNGIKSIRTALTPDTFTPSPEIVAEGREFAYEILVLGSQAQSRVRGENDGTRIEYLISTLDTQKEFVEFKVIRFGTDKSTKEALITFAKNKLQAEK